ncbi:MAG: ABC transporter permease [Acidobacteria bacterium]|nr:MAG: ABC transporter permease [Acidobacteriota bacterium]
MSWRREAAAMFRRDYLTDLRYRVVFLISLVDAALLLASYAFLARVFGAAEPNGYAPLPFLLVGIALTDSLTTSLVCLSQGVRNNQQAGTLKAMLALPLSPARLMLLSMPYPALRAAIDFVIFICMAIALGLPVSTINFGATLVVFLLSVGAMLSLALLSASFTVVFKRGDPVMWALGAATWLLSGVLYPTDVLPPMLARVSSLLPTTHALAAVRATAIDGASLAAVGRDAGVLAAFALIGVPFGLWAFTVAVNHARRAGTLGHT